MSDTEGRDDRFDWSAPEPSSGGQTPPPTGAGPGAGGAGTGAGPGPASPEPWGPASTPPGDGQQWGQQPAPGYGYGQSQGGQGWSAPPTGPVYAHWGLRVGSFLIDWLIPTMALVVFIFIAGAIAGASDSSSGDSAAGVVVVVAYLALLGFWVWNSCLRQGRTGRSVGKQVVGTALVRDSDGSYLGGGMAFVRELAHFLDGLPCYLGYLWPLWDTKRQTFADKLCGTVVVRTR